MKRTFPKAVSRILQKKFYTELQTEGRFLRESAKMCVHTDLIQRSAKPLSAQIQRVV